MEATGKQVDSRTAGAQRCGCTDTGERTATVHIEVGKAVCIRSLGIVEEHIGVFLHGIVQRVVTRVTGTAAKDVAQRVARVVFGHEVNERVVIQVREVESFFRSAIVIGVVFEDTVFVVVVTIVATEDGIDTPLDVLHVGAGTFQLIVEDWSCGSHVMVDVALDSATEVVTAIDVVAYPREAAVIAYMHLRATIDVGIGSAAEGVVHTAVAQVDIRVAQHVALATAAIDVFCLGNRLSALFLRVTRVDTSQIDRGAVGCVIDVVTFGIFLTDDTFLTASEHLEGIAVGMVDGGAAPDLGILTVSGAEHRH